jgi:hypothetical protein
MVPTCPSPAVGRSSQCIQKWDIQETGQPEPELAGWVDPVRDLSTPCPGHGHDREVRNTRTDHRDDQVGICGETPIFETVHQLPGGADMLERGDQAHSPIQNSLGRRSQIFPASTAHPIRAQRETRLTQHRPRRYEVEPIPTSGLRRNGKATHRRPTR